MQLDLDGELSMEECAPTSGVSGSELHRNADSLSADPQSALSLKYAGNSRPAGKSLGNPASIAAWYLYLLKIGETGFNFW